jgi:hypothetical protein
MMLVKTDSQPVANSMYLKLALPWLMAVTKPEPETDAIAGVNEVQIPPTVGLSWLDWPMQIILDPISETEGGSLMVIIWEESEIQPVVV